MGSLLLTEMISQIGEASHTSPTGTLTATETILWFGGHRISGLAVTGAILGGVVSTTITVELHSAVFPESSKALQPIEVSPSENVEPDGGVHSILTTPGQLSVVS